MLSRSLCGESDSCIDRRWIGCCFARYDGRIRLEQTLCVAACAKTAVLLSKIEGELITNVNDENGLKVAMMR